MRNALQLSQGDLTTLVMHPFAATAYIVMAVLIVAYCMGSLGGDACPSATEPMTIDQFASTPAAVVADEPQSGTP